MDVHVTDKIVKNARKYPADQVRGSSKKYSDYASSTSDANLLDSSVVASSCSESSTVAPQTIVPPGDLGSK